MSFPNSSSPKASVAMEDSVSPEEAPEQYQFVNPDDCTPKCRSVQHGDSIYILGSRGSDAEIINVWSKTCLNYGHVKDSFSRTALHVAASFGKLKVVTPFEFQYK